MNRMECRSYAKENTVFERLRNRPVISYMIMKGEMFYENSRIV